MRIRPLNRAAIIATLIAKCAFLPMASQAVSLDDPFSTDALVTPPHVTQAQENASPCQSKRLSMLTLTDVIDATLCANPQTREVWANARVRAAEVGRAQSTFLPTLDGSISASRDKNRGGALPGPVRTERRNYELSMSWLLYDFGGREANLANARELLAAANASQDARVQSLLLAAVQAYYGLQSSQAARDAALEAEKAAQQSFRAAEARYQAGVATPADKLQAQTAWSQATLNRISAEGDVKSGLGTIANVMGLAANAEIGLAPVKDAMPGQIQQTQADVQGLIDGAVRNRPDLRASEARVRAANSAIDRARAKDRPSLSLGVSGNSSRSGSLPDGNSSALGLTLKIPLFSGFDSTYQIRAAEAEAEASRAQSEQTRLQVALDVWNAYYSLATAGQSLNASADLAASAEQSHRVSLGRYKAGLGTILDVLNAQSALASAHQQRIQALYSWLISRVSLAQAMGTLDDSTIESLVQRTEGNHQP